MLHFEGRSSAYTEKWKSPDLYIFYFLCIFVWNKKNFTFCKKKKPTSILAKKILCHKISMCW